MNVIYDERWFNQKLAFFERQFNQVTFDGLAAALGNRFNPEVLVTFNDIEQHYTYYLDLVPGENASLRKFIDNYLSRLAPLCQSPFLLPGSQVTQGPWLGEYKVNHFPLCEVTKETISGKRVLDIGCNAGFDTFLLSAMNPCEIIGIEPSPFYYQALFFWTVYHCPNVRFLQTGWEYLTHEAIGKFDVVNCQGILYHEPSPVHLLTAIYKLLTPGGKLILETHVSLDVDDKARFVEGGFWGDINWWWIPSVDVMCALLRACGFEEVVVRSQNPVPSKNPDDLFKTKEGIPVGGRSFITAIRPLRATPIMTKLSLSKSELL